MQNRDSLSRRSFLKVASALTLSPFIPVMHTAHASELLSTESWVPAVPNLTKQELDSITDEKVHEEGLQLIQQLMEYDTEQDLAYSSRPTYDNVYESPQYKYTGYHRVSGQPNGGVMISGGGSIYIIPNAGGTGSITFSFGAPWGAVAVNYPLGNRASTVTSYSVNIPAGVYCLATQNTCYKCVPYTTYRTVNGVRSVYSRQVSTQVYSYAFSYMRV